MLNNIHYDTNIYLGRLYIKWAYTTYINLSNMYVTYM